MKKLAFSSIVFISLVLSSCIDIFQHITKDGNGIDKNTIKVTVSKAVFAMANGLSGAGDNIDYEELFNESNNIDIKEYNQFNAIVKNVNDTMDVGYLVEMNIDYRNRDIINERPRGKPRGIEKV
jgi:hypothetical protein